MKTAFVHRFSPSPSGDSRTLLVLHGTGGDENSLVQFGRSIAPDFAILSPRGKVIENGMPRFFRRFAEGVFDYEDIRTRANELADFVIEASQEYGFEPAKTYAFGYSNGANVAWSATLLRPEVLAGGVLFRPMVTLTGIEPDLNGKRFLISAGRNDPIVPTENVERLVEQITSLGAEVQFTWHQGGHELGRDEIKVATEWIKTTG